MSISFWQLPEDELVLLQFLHDNGAVALVNQPISRKKKLRSFSPLEIPQTESPGPYLLTREEYVDTLVRVPPLSPRGDLVFVCTIHSCVLSYSRGKKIDRQWEQAHSSCHKGFWDQEGEWVTKPKEFIAWADKIHRWIRRKHATAKAELRGFWYPATPAVVGAVEKRRMKLML
jgi:hypothetical protein